MRPYFYIDGIKLTNVALTKETVKQYNRLLEVVYYLQSINQVKVTIKSVLETIKDFPDTETFEYAIDPSFSLTFDQLLSNTVPLIEWYSTKTIKVAINYAALQALHYKQFNTYPSREQLRALIKKQFPQIKTGHQLAQSLDPRIKQLREKYKKL